MSRFPGFHWIYVTGIHVCPFGRDHVTNKTNIWRWFSGRVFVFLTPYLEWAHVSLNMLYSLPQVECTTKNVTLNLHSVLYPGKFYFFLKKEYCSGLASVAAHVLWSRFPTNVLVFLKRAAKYNNIVQVHKADLLYKVLRGQIHGSFKSGWRVVKSK